MTVPTPPPGWTPTAPSPASGGTAAPAAPVSALAQDLADLRALVASRHHVLLVDSDDEARLLALVREAAATIPVWTWTATRGLARDGLAGQPGTAALRGALGFVAALPGPAVVVLLDAGGLGEDEVAVRLVKDLALGGQPGLTLLVSGVPQTPATLDGAVLRWRLRRPRREELEALVRRVLDQARAAGVPVLIPDADVPDVAAAVAGLALPQAERAILRAGAEDGRLAPDDLPRIRAAKAELLAEASPLDLVDADVDLSAVGGLERLKAWLAERRRGFEPAAAAFGLAPPRGVLLTGVPGCGKSLAAKAVARSWGLPLVLLDVGRIYGSFLGQSEARLRQALDAVEAMAPVVLWIDEIEKGFGTDEGAQDGGASARVLAASVFHFGDLTIGAVKDELRRSGHVVR